MEVNERYLLQLIEFYTSHGKSEKDEDIHNVYACGYCPCYLRVCNPYDKNKEYKKLSCKEKILNLLKEETETSELSATKHNTLLEETPMVPDDKIHYVSTKVNPSFKWEDRR